jgi:hypothetical protein
MGGARRGVASAGGGPGVGTAVRKRTDGRPSVRAGMGEEPHDRTRADTRRRCISCSAASSGSAAKIVVHERPRGRGGVGATLVHTCDRDRNALQQGRGRWGMSGPARIARRKNRTLTEQMRQLFSLLSNLDHVCDVDHVHMDNKKHKAYTTVV